MVGERGITLSGGQKARVSLARMAYRPGINVAIMDDPLSAVDPSVASHLFEKCICGLLSDTVSCRAFKLFACWLLVPYANFLVKS